MIYVRVKYILWILTVKVLFLIDLPMKYLPGSLHYYGFLYLCFNYLIFKFLVVTGSLIKDPLIAFFSSFFWVRYFSCFHFVRSHRWMK
jgi:hypothetical protein